MHKHLCQFCGVEFYNRRRIAKYCSHACANTVANRKKIKNIFIECQSCKKHFPVKPGDLKYRKIIKYCSRKCTGKGRYQKDKHVIVKCSCCGKDVEKKKYRLIHKNYFCNRECQVKYQKIHPPRKANGWWFENGYKVLYSDNGDGIKEHVKIMQDHIGRKLKKGECVHHKDGDILNNNLNNLQIMTIAEHMSHHRKNAKPGEYDCWRNRKKN